jgi:hypothetical protein
MQFQVRNRGAAYKLIMPLQVTGFFWKKINQFPGFISATGTSFWDKKY